VAISQVLAINGFLIKITPMARVLVLLTLLHNGRAAAEPPAAAEAVSAFRAARAARRRP